MSETYTVGNRVTLEHSEGTSEGTIIGAIVKLDKDVYVEWNYGKDGAVYKYAVILDESHKNKYISSVLTVKSFKVKKD